MAQRKYEILRRPVFTEKTDILEAQHNQYVFEVDLEASKPEIRDAIEELFGVQVEGVRTMIMPGKRRRWGRQVTHTSAWKKAVVTLADGDKIEMFE